MPAAVRILRAAVALALAVAAIVAAAPAGAGAPAPPRVSRRDTYLSRQPGAPTGLRVAIDYRNPANPGGKPPAVDTVIDRFAPGFRIDTAAPEQCLASDFQMASRGGAACPPGSIVGLGEIDVANGLPRPDWQFRTAITFVNRAGQLILIAQDRSTGVRAIVHGYISNGDTITIPVRLFSTPMPLPGLPVDLGAALTGNLSPRALLPGTPWDTGAIRRERLLFPAMTRIVGGRRRSYLTTPAHCPRSGRWRNQSEFVFDDGTTSTTSDTTPCRRRRMR